MNIPFTKLVSQLPSSVPFVGPETLERQRGSTFAARIGANESAFGISPRAIEAIQQAIAADSSSSGCSWYGDPENHELRCLLADKHQVDPEEICVDAGIDSLLGLTVRMLINPEDAVVTSLGAYPTFNYHVQGFGAALHTVPYKDFHEDINGLIAKAADTRARLVYLSNPDNPMGTSHSASTVQTMIDNVPDGCILLLDEAYNEFAKSGLAPVIDTNNPQVIRYRTFSKAYGMAGMRIGYAIANTKLIEGFNKIRNHFAVNRLAQIAAVASLRDETFLPHVLKQVQTGRERVYQMARELELDYLESATNFVAVDTGNGDNTREILKQLGEQGVFIRMPGIAPLDRYLRVGIGTEEEHATFEASFSQLIKKHHPVADI